MHCHHYIKIFSVGDLLMSLMLLMLLVLLMSCAQLQNNAQYLSITSLLYMNYSDINLSLAFSFIKSFLVLFFVHWLLIQQLQDHLI